MAVDFFHRLVVTGPRGTVGLFRGQLRHRATRSVAGHKWRETIPFSFERLYQLVPTAVRIEPNAPCDPYDISVWPILHLPCGFAEVRYQLHTRNMELRPFMRLLSKRFAALTFRLVTFCLDDSEIATYRVRDGRVRMWILPQERHEAQWERARQKFGLTGDDVYDDDDAEHFAEEAMLEEALNHWEPGSKQPRHTGRRVRSWWNRPVSRDLESERLIAMAQIAERLRCKVPVDASSRMRTSPRRSKSRPRG